MNTEPTTAFKPTAIHSKPTVDLSIPAVSSVTVTGFGANDEFFTNVSRATGVRFTAPDAVDVDALPYQIAKMPPHIRALSADLYNSALDGAHAEYTQAVLLYTIQQTGEYRRAGYKSVSDYGKAVFGLAGSTTLGRAKAGELYSNAAIAPHVMSLPVSTVERLANVDESALTAAFDSGKLSDKTTLKEAKVFAAAAPSKTGRKKTPAKAKGKYWTVRINGVTMSIAGAEGGLLYAADALKSVVSAIAKWFVEEELYPVAANLDESGHPVLFHAVNPFDIEGVAYRLIIPTNLTGTEFAAIDVVKSEPPATQAPAPKATKPRTKTVTEEEYMEAVRKVASGEESAGVLATLKIRKPAVTDSPVTGNP